MEVTTMLEIIKRLEGIKAQGARWTLDHGQIVVEWAWPADRVELAPVDTGGERWVVRWFSAGNSAEGSNDTIVVPLAAIPGCLELVGVIRGEHVSRLTAATHDRDRRVQPADTEEPSRSG